MSLAVSPEPAAPVADGTEVRLAPVAWRGRPVARTLVVTHVVEPGEDLVAVATRYLGGRVHTGDVAVLGQKLVSICQGRCVTLAQARPGPLARALSRTVRRTPHGLGLRRPETMEMALREVGTGRILLACVFGALDRLHGGTGSFYRVAGSRVWAIDGPGRDTLPPYDGYVVLAPDDPDGTARRVARALGCGVAIVDVNDLEASVLGASPGVDRARVSACLRDNPMGQGRARTPLGWLSAARRTTGSGAA